jgi:ABC-type bacteriocin/lantibiotic exporter with double-glycine peptidase domain
MASTDLQRFPALARLGQSSRRREIEFVQQMEWTDCGAACLAMVLGFHHHVASLNEVRNVIGVSRDGVSAKAILDCAERYGLSGRGVKVTIEQLHLLPRASILHWDLNHFVVLDRVLRRGIRIVDPAIGPRTLSFEEVSAAFTGVALQLTPTERLTEKKPSTGRFGRYLRELMQEKRLVARVIVMSLLLRLVGLALPLITGMVIDRVVPRSDLRLLWLTAIGVVGMVIFNTVCGAIRTFLLLHLRMALDTRMTLSFLDHLVSLPFSFFQRRSAGDLMMRVESNGIVREIVTSKTMTAVIDGSFVLIYAAIIFWVQPMLGTVAIGLASLQALIFAGARPSYHRLLAEDLDKRAKEQGYMVQLLGGMETLKCAGAERQAVERWSNLYADGLNVAIRRVRLSTLVDGLRGAISTLAPFVILAMGAEAVMSGHLTLGLMLAMNSLAFQLFAPLSDLVSSALELQLVKGHVDRIDDVLQTALEQPDREHLQAPPMMRGSLSLQNVSFRYAEQGPLILDNISLEIPPGVSVALVGPSGSGKTTLLALLAGLHRPTSGEISYDGIPMHSMDLRLLRLQMGIVPQHPYIFGGSVRDNIGLTDSEATIDRIAAAAAVACLHEDITRMPMGYETIVSDGGASLSGGQRQRIAIARALLRSPSVMLFDEATSALDNVTEARVIENLQQLASTRITIAHRLSTVRHADLILVMDQGRVVEHGRHEDLLALGGLYARLVNAGNSRGTHDATRGDLSRFTDDRSVPPSGYARSR